MVADANQFFAQIGLGCRDIAIGIEEAVLMVPLKSAVAMRKPQPYPSVRAKDLQRGKCAF